MRIRVLDRILVALAGLILLAGCAGVVGQVFFGLDVTGFAARILAPETAVRRIMISVGIAVLLLLGLYCLLMLFRHRRRKDKFILQKMESGDLAISLKTLETMVQKCLDQHQEIKAESIRLENQRDGLLIRIRGTVAGGISIPLTVDTLQKQVKQYVTACSGVEVKGIRIQIEASGEEAKDAPFLIEPPANNLLPKGEKTAAEEPVPAGEEEKTGNSAEQEPELLQEAEKIPAPDEAAAAMAAAESLMDSLETEEDDRPIHQRLFSMPEEPCIMPLPPENTPPAEETEMKAEEEEETEKAGIAWTENREETASEETKGEDNA